MTPMEPFRLDNRVALVTGAARGLGRHFALTLARHGARVAVATRSGHDAAAVVAAVEALGGQAVGVQLDVTEAASVHTALAEVDQRLGPIAILVNNAGVVESQAWASLAEAEWDRVVGTNLKGTWLVAQAVARQMIAARVQGSIINVASILGLLAEPDLPAYCASKAGVLNLTRALALDLAPHGIRVNALAPGYFETDLNRAFLASDAGQQMLRRIPLRRSGALDELDGPLLLLASDASRFMTGSTLVIDGGHSVMA